MTATVPTADEFAALEARVAALEGGAQPEPPPSGTGVQAKRIAKLIESFGVNTFSSLDGGNLWGSWPADYRPDSVADALRYMLGDSGHAFMLREYHYSGRQDMQRTWLRQVTAALPGTEATLCIGANGDVDDVPTMLSLADDPACCVAWVEGLNEPNTDFGSGTIPVDRTMAIQQALWDGAVTPIIMGPSVVAGTPHPEGWILPYFGDQMDAVNKIMHWGNGHYYPPHCPTVPNTGYSVGEYIDGLALAYAQHPIALTEFHPTLYAQGTFALKRNVARLADRLKGREEKIPAFRATEPRDAFYTLMTLLDTVKRGTMGVWWYALYDYGSTYECGLFPKEHTSNPRQTAVALRNLCAICADTGDRHGFDPDNLDITVAGLTEAMDWDVYQASDGRFLVPIWYSAADVGGGPTATVTLTFGSTVDVRMFAPLSGPGVVQEAHVSALDIDLEPGVVVLEVVC